MKRLTSGALLLGAMFTAAACNNVTGDLAGGATRMVADPNPITADTATDHTFTVQTFDDQGSPLVSNATVGTINGPVTVTLDTNYQHGAIRYSTQFKVKGTGLGLATYTINDNGLTVTDTAFVLPPANNSVAIVAPVLPTMGDAVTITIPAGQPFRMTDSTAIFIGPTTVANNKMQLDSISADRLTAYFTANGAAAGFVTVTNTTLPYFAGRNGNNFRVLSTDTVSVFPLAVTSIDAASDADAGNDLTWNRVRGVSPYRILRATAVGGPYAIIDSTIKDVDTTFVDNATTVSGTTYFYKIRACSLSAGCAADSPASAGSAATTPRR